MQFSITPDAVLPVIKCEVEATAAVTLLTYGKQCLVLIKVNRAVANIAASSKRGHVRGDAYVYRYSYADPARLNFDTGPSIVSCFFTC